MRCRNFENGECGRRGAWLARKAIHRYLQSLFGRSHHAHAFAGISVVVMAILTCPGVVPTVIDNCPESCLDRPIRRFHSILSVSWLPPLAFLFVYFKPTNFVSPPCGCSPKFISSYSKLCIWWRLNDPNLSVFNFCASCLHCATWKWTFNCVEMCLQMARTSHTTA